MAAAGIALTLPPPAHAAWQRLPTELVPFDPAPPGGGAGGAARPVWYLAAEGRESVLVASCRAGGGPVLYWVALAGAARAGGRVPPGVAALEVVWRVGDGPAQNGICWAGPTPDMLRPEGESGWPARRGSRCMAPGCPCSVSTSPAPRAWSPMW
ncbi:hypothetical protein [Tistrella mobilis]|uniref:hypothetical protein n=1 Tax=Tistrella mobilis TaxID=171437 RepID=UPI0016516D6D|nr:hypothetical protein [Tistrella mobilis]